MGDVIGQVFEISSMVQVSLKLVGENGVRSRKNRDDGCKRAAPELEGGPRQGS